MTVKTDWRMQYQWVLNACLKLPIFWVAVSCSRTVCYAVGRLAACFDSDLLATGCFCCLGKRSCYRLFPHLWCELTRSSTAADWAVSKGWHLAACGVVYVLFSFLFFLAQNSKQTYMFAVPHILHRRGASSTYTRYGLWTLKFSAAHSEILA